MESTTEIFIKADPDRVFALAAAVERWPRILPHYRWVRRLSGDDRRRTVEMAAWRDIYPVKWRSTVEAAPEQRRLRFVHTGGPARGMEVEWRVTPERGGTHVVIWHRLQSPIPLVGELFADYIVGRLFVNNIAGKTLRRMKLVAERQTAAGADAPTGRSVAAGGVS